MAKVNLAKEYPSQYTDPDECGGYGLTRELAEERNRTTAEWIDGGKLDKYSGDPLWHAMDAARRMYGEARRAWREHEVLTGRRGGRAATYSTKLGTGTSVDIISHLDADGNPDTSTEEGAAYWADVQAAADQGVPNALGPQR